MNEAGTSLSVIALFENADIVVKPLLLPPFAGSVLSWAVTVDKVLRLRAARQAAERRGRLRRVPSKRPTTASTSTTIRRTRRPPGWRIPFQRRGPGCRPI